MQRNDSGPPNRANLSGRLASVESDNPRRKPSHDSFISQQTDPVSVPVEKERFGLIAGWGRLPIITTEELIRQGYEVHCLGIKGHASDILREMCASFREVGIARLGTQRNHLRKLGIRRATMVGKIFKTIMFGRFSWIQHSPDLGALHYLIPHFLTGSKDRRDDSLLLTFVRAFADRGIDLVPATDFAPEILVKRGKLTQRSPQPSQWKDIAFGWQLAKQMGGLDVGQSVAVKRQVAIAVEAIEGTDECIRRAGTLSGGGFTVVKVPKPQQDMRFDVPTVGIDTLKTMVEAGGNVLAIEADRTILLDEHEFLDYANRHKLTVAAVSEDELKPYLPTVSPAATADGHGREVA